MSNLSVPDFLRRPGAQRAAPRDPMASAQPGYAWRASDQDLETYFNQNYTFDPSTGLYGGPEGSQIIPYTHALEAQAAHDRATWLARQRLGRQASQYMEGAAGLLSSFRPGGGAALEANIYGQQAGISLQRANLMTPLDLMSDWRRWQQSRALRAGRKRAQTAAIISGVGAVASLMSGNPMAALGPAANAYGASGSLEGVGQYDANAANAVTPQQVAGQGTTTAPQSPSGADFPGAPQGPPPGQGGAPGMPTAPGAPIQNAPSVGTQQFTPPQAQPPGPVPNIGPSSPGSVDTPPQQGMGPTMGGSGAVTGMDGDFSPTAYGRDAVSSAATLSPEVRVGLAEMEADLIEADPFWVWLDGAIENEAFARGEK